ncbi:MULTISPECIES: zinc-binding dehydrogenase [unclassified Devosia]|uniref:zinc-binding dehydrogenase n=1 Tax=unclassified Devosia TaxID=196773 RepID=UPI000A801D95|nr:MULTISPECIES: zinc-binding dehydrogenase [unclassified Devosia]MBN9364296.1 zinc-binding dehydrogenase [Devosia sp.]
MTERGLMLTAVRQLAFEELSVNPLGPNEVRIRTLFSGISAGTELSQYRGTSPFMSRQWDLANRVFRDAETPSWSFPVRNLGYEEAGEIVETGAAVTRVKPGDRVFGTWGHRTMHVMAEADAADRQIPDGADPRIGMFSHIGAVALNGVHDARIRMGDLVVVFGLGVPGQIVLQAARASGATVVGVDPVASRRAMAERLGADRTLDPGAGSISDTIKGETGGRGADICIEVSGAAPALAEAMRTVAYASRVVAMGFFQGEARGLQLGDEFHHNRIELISSQISGVAPDASHRWSKLRLWQTAVRLQHEGRLNLLPLITDTVPFAEAPALFARLDQGDPAILQSVLDFGASS